MQAGPESNRRAEYWSGVLPPYPDSSACPFHAARLHLLAPPLPADRRNEPENRPAGPSREREAGHLH